MTYLFLGFYHISLAAVFSSPFLFLNPLLAKFFLSLLSIQIFSLISMAFNIICVLTIPIFISVASHVPPNFSRLHPTDYFTSPFGCLTGNSDLTSKIFTILASILFFVSLPLNLPHFNKRHYVHSFAQEKGRSHPIYQNSC